MEILLYTKPGCQGCRMSKAQLDKRAVTFTPVDVAQNTERLQDIIDLGYQSLPVIVVKDGEQIVKHWNGYQPHEIAAL